MYRNLPLAKLSIQRRQRINQLLGRSPSVKLLQKMEANKGPLDSKIKRLCNEYSVDVLGDKVYATWLYIYCLVAGKFKIGWIPDNYYELAVLPRLKGRYGEASALNVFQSIVFEEGFPDIVYAVNGFFLTPSLATVELEKLEHTLFAQSDRLVFKTDDSKQGKGVRIIRRSEFPKLDVKSFPNGVFQPFIEQHPSLKEFHPGSVATLRMTTVADCKGKVSLRACYLRIGTGRDTHVKSASHIRVPVDMTEGCLSEVGYTVDWHPIDAHPFSDRKFDGASIPCFEAAREMVLRLHGRVPFIRCVGWDLTIAREGQPVVMEWNGAHNDIKFSEATQGPCFSDLGWENLWRK